MEPQKNHRKPDVLNMAYSNCNTRIVSLLDLDLPDSATEEEYRGIYEEISRTQTPQARLLTDAITSVKTGLAPPVAFPTETVYGLGADATNQINVAGIFAAKGRPSDNPLIVHVASKEHLERLTGEPIPAAYEDLVEDHWPGPLTILVPVPQNSIFAKNVHPGQNTIGFRVPESKYARFLIAASEKPIAGPSANSSGKPSPTWAQHVMDDLKGKINFILDGGDCAIGVESTVVDGLHDPPLILRPGGISHDDLLAHGKKYNNIWTKTDIGYKQNHLPPNGTTSHDNNSDEGTNSAPRAPGMKYKHYAPHGKMILFTGIDSYAKATQKLKYLLENTQASSIGILPSTTWNTLTPSVNYPKQTGTKPQRRDVHHIALGQTPRRIAQTLFAALRTCDRLGCHYILAEAPQRPANKSRDDEEKEGDGVEVEVDHHYDAVIERMRKAASEVIE